MSKNALLPNSVQFFIGHGSCINQLTSQQGDIEIEADLKYFLAAVLYQFDGRCQPSSTQLPSYDISMV